jgi:hypothetical protein
VNHLPAPDNTPTAPAAGQATNQLTDAVIRAAVDNAIHQARRQGTTPEVVIGTTPPVPQPGRPAMSQKAVDLNTTILSISVVIGMTGLAATGVLVASGHANQTVIAWVCACVVAVPAALALPVLALKALMKSAKEVVQAAPPTIHNHYSGQITQTTNTINADTRGLVAITRNELPPAR